MTKINLGDDNTLKTILRLIIPAMAGQLVAVLYGIVDRIFVGNVQGYGQIALVGLGVCIPITTLISSFAYLVALGASPLFSISLGQKREDNAKRILSNALLLELILSAVTLIIFYAVLTPMLYAFGASETSFSYAFDYMIYYLTGVPFILLGLCFNQFLTAQGESFKALLSTAVSCIVNIILDPIFLYVLPLGIKGAAIATVISWVIYFLLGGYYLLKKTTIKISFGNYKWSIMAKILKLGLSPFVILATDSLVIILLNAILQQTGGENGDFYIECQTIITAFFSLITGPLLGISSGSQPILGYLFGARDIPKLKKAFNQILLCGIIFTGVCFGLSFLVSKPFASLFVLLSKQQGGDQVIEASSKFILVYMYGAIPLAFQYVCVDALTGMGQAKYSIWLSLNRKIVLLLPLTIILPYATKDSTSAFYAEPISDLVAGIISFVAYLIITPRIFKKQLTNGEASLI